MIIKKTIFFELGFLRGFSILDEYSESLIFKKIVIYVNWRNMTRSGGVCYPHNP